MTGTLNFFNSGAHSSANVTLDLSALEPVDPPPTEDPPGEDPPNEERATDEGAGEPMVSITIEVVDSNGSVTDELGVGEQAVLNIYVEDTRLDAKGVFSVAVDVNYDSGRINLDEQVEFGPEYQSSTRPGVEVSTVVAD